VKIVTALGPVFFAGGIYLVARDTVVLGSVVLLLGLFDVVLAASIRGSTTRRDPKSGQRGTPGPAPRLAWRVLFVVGSFAAIGAAVGASGGVKLAVGLAIFAGLIALYVSLVMVGGRRSSKDGRS
jgi:hypothetical protein